MPKIKTKTVYLCSSCGDDHPKWSGQCPSCNEWGTLSEFKVSKDRKIINQKSEKPIDLKSAYNTPQLERFLTEINEIDRVPQQGGFALIAPAWNCRSWTVKKIEQRL